VYRLASFHQLIRHHHLVAVITFTVTLTVAVVFAVAAVVALSHRKRPESPTESCP
jgi:heme/copper-type cytochrome/quinol oxidase subunit 2